MRGVATRAKTRLQRIHVARFDDDAVIARTAQQHISAAKAGEGVMARSAGQGLAQAGAHQGVVACSTPLVDFGQYKGAASRAKDHIATTRASHCSRVTQVGAHDQVGQAVAVDVARRCHADAAAVQCALAVDDKAANAVGHRAQLDGGAAVLAKHQVAAPSIHAGAGISALGANDQVGQAVAVDVTGTGYAPTAVVAADAAVDHKTTRARGHRAQVDCRAAGLAKHHIAAPGAEHRCGARIAIRRADDQVGQAVTVDITCTRHTPAAVVTGTLPIDDKAARPAGHRAEVDGRARRGAKHHVAAPGIGPGRGARVAVRSAHNQVGQAVTVDVARSHHTETALVQGALAVEDKAARSCGHRTELDRCAAAFAKHHIAAPRIGDGSWVAQVGAHNQVDQAVAVDVTGTGYAPTAVVAADAAVDHKTTRARGHRAQFHRRTAGLAKHHIAAARIGAGRGPRVTLRRTHNQVSQTVTVDIANPRNAHTALVAGTLAIDDKAAGAQSHR